MKSQLFTNIILTLITGLLVIILLQNSGIIETAKKDVQIVSIVKPNHTDKNDEMKWDDLPIIGNVRIHEPVVVKIQTFAFDTHF